MINPLKDEIKKLKEENALLRRRLEKYNKGRFVSVCDECDNQLFSEDPRVNVILEIRRLDAYTTKSSKIRSFHIKCWDKVNKEDLQERVNDLNKQIDERVIEREEEDRKYREEEEEDGKPN